MAGGSLRHQKQAGQNEEQVRQDDQQHGLESHDSRRQRLPVGVGEELDVEARALSCGSKPRTVIVKGLSKNLRQRIEKV